MNNLALTARVVGAPDIGKGRDGTPKTCFEVTTDGGPEGALYFSCVAFGHAAIAAAQLKEGDRVLLAGKLATSRYAQAMSLIVSSFELLRKEGTDA